MWTSWDVCAWLLTYPALLAAIVKVVLIVAFVSPDLPHRGKALAACVPRYLAPHPADIPRIAAVVATHAKSTSPDSIIHNMRVSAALSGEHRDFDIVLAPSTTSCCGKPLHLRGVAHPWLVGNTTSAYNHHRAKAHRACDLSLSFDAGGLLPPSLNMPCGCNGV